MLSSHLFKANSKRQKKHSRNDTQDKTDPFISKIKRTIQLNLDNDQFDAAFLARQSHLSISQLNRRLNQLIGQPAGQLIQNMKMEYAAELLDQGVAAIGDIAFQVGYKNQAHFCRSFKRSYGCTPSEFKNRINYAQYW